MYIILHKNVHIWSILIVLRLKYIVKVRHSSLRFDRIFKSVKKRVREKKQKRGKGTVESYCESVSHIWVKGRMSMADVVDTV